MTQEEFNAMLQTALAQGLPGGHYLNEEFSNCVAKAFTLGCPA